MLDRIKHFTSTITSLTNEDGEGANGSEDVVVIADNAEPSVENSVINNTTATDSEGLFTHVRNLLSVTSVDEVVPRALAAASFLEGKQVVRGSVCDERKAKSLVQRWLIKRDADKPDPVSGPASPDEVIVERDTILLVNVKVGSGATAATVQRPFRVVELYEKYYNKWFMSKVPFKKWKNEPKPYKLKVRMLSRNIVMEYKDVELCDVTYNKDDICKIITDSMIIGVVGKLQQID